MDLAGKPHDPEVPEWLQKVRSTDSERDAKLHSAMDIAARKGLQRKSVTITSQGWSPVGSPSAHDHLAGMLTHVQCPTGWMPVPCNCRVLCIASGCTLPAFVFHNAVRGVVPFSLVLLITAFLCTLGSDSDYRFL
jgi:hypothetical protein